MMSMSSSEGHVNEPRKSPSGESRPESRIVTAPSAAAGTGVDSAGEGLGSGSGDEVAEGELRDRQASRLSVLVVDDEESIREFFAVFLAQEGHRVKTLDDPRHALEVLRADTYHVVILDLMMPELSGMDLLEQIRRTDDDIAIVICTGYPTVETATVSISHEVSAYIRKPFEPA